MLTADVPQVSRWRKLREDVLAADLQTQAHLLQQAADAARATVVQTISRAGLGHVGGDLSVLDILTVLYAAVLRVDPERPDWTDRDRLVLSKGHCAVSLYTTLARCGYFPAAALSTFTGPLSELNGHPDRKKVPGVETNTGPLGHGFPFAVGAAIAGRLAASQRRVFVVLGDGELQEGSNWEAMMTAGHRELGNLVAVVDRNRLQQGDRTESTNRLDPLAPKWRSFGWQAEEIDGHDPVALLQALSAPASGQPRCLIANTVKGKGVSFMEDRVEWHHKVPSQDQAEMAIAELTR
ncbi:MAG: transketolase [Frankiaceae bacterium]